jgi:cell division protein ZapA
VPKVDISINGRLYAVACGEGEENRVRELAGMVDARVRQLVGPNPTGAVGETHLLVLAGLMLADELSEAAGGTPQAAAPPQNGADNDQDVLIAAVDHLTDRIAVIAERLARA